MRVLSKIILEVCLCEYIIFIIPKMLTTFDADCTITVLTSQDTLVAFFNSKPYYYNNRANSLINIQLLERSLDASEYICNGLGLARPRRLRYSLVVLGGEVICGRAHFGYHFRWKRKQIFFFIGPTRCKNSKLVVSRERIKVRLSCI